MNGRLRVSAREKAAEVSSLLLQLQPEIERPSWSEEDLEQWFEDPHPKPRHDAREQPPQPLSPRKIMYGVDDETGRVIIKISTVFLIVSYLVLIGTLIYVLHQFIMYEYEDHVIAWTIGGAFVLAAVPLALQDIHFHVINYVSPLQRHYIRILWMIPIYSIESWLALRFNNQKLYLETMREAYEAYVVYSFFKLMREFVGSKQQAVAKLAKLQQKHGRKQAKMLVPCCCLYAWRLDGQFLTRCSLGVFQYVFIRTLCAAIACILEHYHLFGEGHYHWDQFYLYYVFIVNVSQCWALYCLVLFYNELKQELRPIRPLPKFLIVKAVVFFSWWQNVILAGMAGQGQIVQVLDYSAEDVGKALQNLLICAEMLVYVIFFHNIFSYKDFKYLEETHAMRMNPRVAMQQMLPTDVLREGRGYVDRAKRLVPGSRPKPGDLEMGNAAPQREEGQDEDSAALEPTYIGKGHLKVADIPVPGGRSVSERTTAKEGDGGGARSRSAEPARRGEAGQGRRAEEVVSPPAAGPLSPRADSSQGAVENAGRWG